jgi:hypothetical protein
MKNLNYLIVCLIILTSKVVTDKTTAKREIDNKDFGWKDYNTTRTLKM